MGTQIPQLSDSISNLNQRVTALENANIDTSQPVDMYRSFVDTAIANDSFKVFTHKYRTCSSAYAYVTPSLIEPVITCSTKYIL